MANKLTVSVMSLREYPADEEGPSKFYVRVRTNDGESMQTEAKGPSAGLGSHVNFMEHLIIPYRDVKKEQLKFELFQASPTGDLVLGECVMRVADVVAAQTVHSWFPFVDATDPELKAGELLMAIQDKRGDRSSTASQPRASQPRASLPRQGSAPEKLKVVTAQRPKRPASGKRASLKLPVPLACAVALAASAYMFLNSKKPIYYDVEEGDTLCTISECHNRDYRDVYIRNRDVVYDPDLIYPGDRIRIQ